MNFLLVPMELSRVVSALLHAVGSSSSSSSDNSNSNDDDDDQKSPLPSEEEEAVEQMRCYVRATSKVGKYPIK